MGQGFISAVPVHECERATVQGEIDHGSRVLLAAERDCIAALRKANGRPLPTDKDLTGLALSGGGIRSATFSLGVLQALASQNLLPHFDYLSTVSGGGYIGASVTWLTSNIANEKARNADLKHETFGIERTSFPYGTDNPVKAGESDNVSQVRMLRFLRQHGNYLAPGGGISLSAGFAVVLRGMLLNFLVWVPLLVVAFAILLWMPSVFQHLPSRWVGWADLPYPAWRSLLILASLGCVAFAVSCILYSMQTFRESIPEAQRYLRRRRFEQKAGYLLFVILTLVLVATIPTAHAALRSVVAESGGPAALIFSGLGSGFWVFLRGGPGGQQKKFIIPTPVIAVIGAALLLYGLLLLAYDIALLFPVERWPYVAGLAATAFVVGWFVDINLITLHRFYRDRLMEAFMPNIGRALKNRTGHASEADGANLEDVWPPPKKDAPADHLPRSPYCIINTNAVLVDSDQLRYRARGGDSFILSPLYCGSTATGWRATDEFLDGGLSLATAMAISGAAADPNAGAIGLTRNVFVSLLMNLLNVRLGYWVENPDPDRRRFRKTMKVRWPNHFVTAMYELGKAFGFGYRENLNFIHLADGGHFENLGIYELFRRRVRLIVVCDGAQDNDSSFGDLKRALDLVQSDFGATVNFGANLSMLEPLIPAVRKHPYFPNGVGIAAQGFVTGEITYRGQAEKGILIYLKTTMIDGLSLRTVAYKRAHPKFPDQSTADQFFDEDQFEAYRELGYRIASDMIERVDLRQQLGAKA